MQTTKYLALALCLLAALPSITAYTDVVSILLEDIRPRHILSPCADTADPLCDFVQDLLSPLAAPSVKEAGKVADSHNETQPAPSCDKGFMLKPQFEILETKQGIVLIGKTPGLSKDDISVEITDGPDGRALEIAGGSRDDTCQSTAAVAPSDQAAKDIQVGYAKFKRRIRLSQHADASTLEAKYHDGLLVVRMLKSTKVDRQKVVIKSAADP